jgi:hypothetical protein
MSEITDTLDQIEGLVEHLRTLTAESPSTAPPPPPPPSDPVLDDTTMPDAPIFPIGTQETAPAFKATTSTVSVQDKNFTDDYIAVKHTDRTLFVQQLDMSDCMGSAVGSFFYCGAGCGVGKAYISRIDGENQLKGRPAFRLFGPSEEIIVEDVWLGYQDLPNTDTGDIATGLQIGEKFDNSLTGSALAADMERKRIKLLRVTRMHVENILDDWPQDRYWNGDGVTVEESVDRTEIDHLFVKNVPDGGVDLKSRSNWIGLLRVEQARAAAKLWDDTTIERVVSLNPRCAGGIGGASHFRLQGNIDRPPIIVLNQVYAVGNEPLIRVENGPVIIHGNGHFEGPSLLAKANGGSLVPGSTWNGELIA